MVIIKSNLAVTTLVAIGATAHNTDFTSLPMHLIMALFGSFLSVILLPQVTHDKIYKIKEQLSFGGISLICGFVFWRTRDEKVLSGIESVDIFLMALYLFDSDMRAFIFAVCLPNIVRIPNILKRYIPRRQRLDILEKQIEKLEKKSKKPLEKK